MSDLKNVKVGDRLAEVYQDQFGKTAVGLQLVTRLTKTQMITRNCKGSECRWRISDGFQVGSDGWNPRSVVTWCLEHDATHAAQQARYKYNRLTRSLKDMSLTQGPKQARVLELLSEALELNSEEVGSQ